MNLFTIIDDSAAILRLKNGVYKQVSVYHRDGKLYVPFSGGFVRICASFSDSYGTSHPSVKVMEIDAEGAVLTGSVPSYQPAEKRKMKAVA